MSETCKDYRTGIHSIVSLKTDKIKLNDMTHVAYRSAGTDITNENFNFPLVE